MPEYSDRDWESYSQNTANADFETLPSQPAASPPQLPDPIPLIRPKEQSEPFPAHALGPLELAATAIVHRTDAPFALAAQSALAAASLATQAHADVETLQSPKPVSVFALSVAESGERKSACDMLALQGVREFERKRQLQYAERFQSYQNEADLYDSQRRAILSKKQDADAARAGLDNLGPEPKAPIAPELLLTDPTMEGLLKHYEVSQPCLGIFSDEGGQFLGGFGMTSDNRLKTAAAMSKFWDGGSVNRTRSSTGPSRTFYDKRLTTHLMIQPRIAEALLADETLRDQGLLSRMLIAWPVSRIGQRKISMTVDPAADARAEQHLSAFHRRIDALLDSGLPETSSPRHRRALALSPEARDVLIQYYNTIEERQADGGAFHLIRGFASKAVEQAVRLSGVLQLYLDDTSEQVEVAQIASGIALMDWYLSETKRLLEATAVPEPLQKAEKLRLWLVHKWRDHCIDIRTIVRLGPNAIRNATLARETVQVLERNGWLRRENGPQIVNGSNSHTVWRVVRP
ncbi:MAG: YfjI family protein [Paracoccaceae bacterium]|nr:YfjI family protein [Paracoccaceae bacterium]